VVLAVASVAAQPALPLEAECAPADARLAAELLALVPVRSGSVPDGSVVPQMDGLLVAQPVDRSPDDYLPEAVPHERALPLDDFLDEHWAAPLADDYLAAA
jgi:hypothetical protein